MALTQTAMMMISKLANNNGNKLTLPCRLDDDRS